MKKMFRLEDYPDKNYAMFCTNRQDANAFCDYLHKHGRCWTTGDSYYVKSLWDSEKDHILYVFNQGKCSYLPLNLVDYQIFNYKNFDFSDCPKTFTKSDLQDFDIAIDKSGHAYFVNTKLNALVARSGSWISLDAYKDDMTYGRSIIYCDYTIVKVYRPDKPEFCALHNRSYANSPVIYDREKETVEEMTMEEICKALGKNIKIVKGD